MTMKPTPEAQWDTPNNDLKMNYAICTMPRTGSNLLGFTLATQGLGIPLEYWRLFTLNPNIKDHKDSSISDIVSRTGLGADPRYSLQNCNDDFILDYTQRLIRLRTSAKGVFGIKVFLSNIMGGAQNLSLLQRVFPQPLKIVFLYRKDVIAQSISLVWAVQSGVWFEGMKSTVEEPNIFYNFPHILSTLRDIRKQQQAWKSGLTQLGVEPLLLSYEELTTHYEESITKFNAFLGYEGLPVPSQPIAKQEDPRKAEFKQRFIQEVRKRKIRI